jgi:hypothetical protein
MGLVTVGCASSGHSHVAPSAQVNPPTARSSPSAPSSSPPPRAPTLTGVRAQLLTLRDQPQGWTFSKLGKRLVISTSNWCGEQPPDETRSPIDIGFQAPADNPIVGEWLGVYPSGIDVQRVIAELQHSATECASISSGRRTYAFRPLIVPSVGDYSAAVQFTSGMTTIESMFIEVGRDLVELAVGSHGPGTALLLRLAKRAVQRSAGAPLSA